MDDPWGSPWASTDTPADNDNDNNSGPPSSVRADIFLSPPPKAFFSNATSLSPQSPWSGHHDDGGLGIWSTAGRADDADNQNEWGTWANSIAQPPRLSPRLIGSGKESPLAWPENAAASPVLIANSRSRTPSILRHHSPDPWATELSLTNRPDAALPDSTKTTTSDTPALALGRVGEVSQASPAVTGREGEGNTSSESALAGKEFTVGGNDYPRTSYELASGHAKTSLQLDSSVFELPSRPSSTCTIDSHDEPERQDSPITSIDEDRGARRQNGLRKTPGIVQELVGKYDGLARAVSEEPPVLGRRGLSQTASRDGSRVRSEIEDDNNDEVGFGNFEDALADDGGAARSPGNSSSSDFSSTPKAEVKDIFARKSEHEEDHLTTTETIPTQAHPRPNQFQDVKFDTHLSFVDKLFPDLADSPENCSKGNWEIPDHGVHDSFTTISERKGWYRISRYGSIRKHNSGDDENYQSVTWPTSQLHSDTIKIVRRWMEEDLYAGRATLGGTKRTGFFDWDSDAAPVELDQVFRRRKSVTKHTRTASIPANNTSIQLGLLDERPHRNSTGISLPAELQSSNQPIMAIPSFGWNSGTKEIPLATPIPLPSGQTLNSVSVLAPVETTFIEEDDDDWGEMVSSPRITNDHTEPNIPTFPPPETSSKNHETKPRPSLTTSGPKIANSRDASTTESDPWSFSDISVLDKSKPLTDQTGETFSGSNVNVPLPTQGVFEPLKQTPPIEYETPSAELITGRVPVNKSSNGVSAVPSPRCGNGSQDDIVVQKILHHLPDLSYMFR
ncbi:hypothetical protein F5Y09DRAFT_108485 [Xylaria sp. FL1042]|nr:hypothetical protein F5Y09DRAFT_108485 [Xylaria sp. FL1042]